ncbi:MAG: hypothetical protein EZS28_016654 [Streblomastix strix]|uniref:Uncharacterized protein n=1 Tax=Streblomastix strix TaxID=222440 RepID=A0A5J4VZZ1_9EUKA|nr:MAG: hypothetical protein EZS28_016654 [Streblomastix strix]
MQTQIIVAQSFNISKQQFYDQPVTQLTNDGAHYTRAPLGARGLSTCSCVQTCQISWQIEIPANTLAIQVNGIKNNGAAGLAQNRQISNYNAIATGVWNTPQTVTMKGGIEDTQQAYDDSDDGTDEHIKFWLGFSTACGPFNQIVICKDSQKLWDTLIYAREQAIIASNSLTNECTSNSVTVSPLESIVQGKRHYGWSNGSELTKPYLQQLSCIDQKLCLITYITLNVRLLIRPEGKKPDIICLKNKADNEYSSYAIRLVNMEGKPNTTTIPAATIKNEAVIVDMIRQTRLVNFPSQVLRTQSSNYPASNIADGGGFIQTIMSFANIKSVFFTFAMPQYPTWFFPVLFKNIDLIIDQRHVISRAYPALTQDVCGQMFDCFVDQDVVSASSDLYHSLVFENESIDDHSYPYGIEVAGTVGQLRPVSNIFYATTLYRESKAIKTYYPNKFMLAWKLATDDLFMRGYNSSKIGARTNIQVQLGMTPVNAICTDDQTIPADLDQKQLQLLYLNQMLPQYQERQIDTINPLSMRWDCSNNV